MLLQPEGLPEDPMGLSEPPPFTLQDMRDAIPKSCFKKQALRSFSYLVRDVLIVAGLAFGAQAVNSWYVGWQINHNCVLSSVCLFL